MKNTIIALSVLLLTSLAACKKGNPYQVETVKDICGNVYPVVKIGSQLWMAENMRCARYDTQSEHAGVTLSTSKSAVSTPYYTDASNKSNWEENKYAQELSEEQISKLGYLYNGAAIIGLKNGNGQGNNINGIRQGICPNGFHVPTSSELDALIKTVCGVCDGEDIDSVNDKLKTKKGWSTKGYYSGNGNDNYGFAALPSGYACGSLVRNVGTGSYFAFYVGNGEFEYLSLGYGAKKYRYRFSDKNTYSVRCVKD